VEQSFTVRSGGDPRVRERMDCSSRVSGRDPRDSVMSREKMDCSSRVCRERLKSCNSWASMVRRWSGGVGVGSERPRGGGRQRVLGGRGDGSRVFHKFAQF